VIGGLITKAEDVLESKVPYLGDIPLIGSLFRFDSRQARRTELLIFLCPRIVHGDTDVELFKQIEMERLHFFEDEAELLHGPLMGVPAETIGPLDGSATAYPDMQYLLPEPAPMQLGPASGSPLEEPLLEAPPQAPAHAPETPVEPRKPLFRMPKLMSR
jgi:hypothetical protein